jgi:hypothetical protein
MRCNSLVLLGLCALLALPHAAWAAGAGGQQGWPWEHFPSRQWSLQQLDPIKSYPDWHPSSVKFDPYFEAEQTFGATYAITTCKVYDTLYFAVAYYSNDGNVYLLKRPLKGTNGQQITLTWPLPMTSDEGVSRLLVLKREPSSADLQLLLVNPVSPAGPVANVLAEQWLGREPGRTGPLPWEDLAKLPVAVPSGFTYGAWPVCRVWLLADLSLAAKDCSAATDCLANFVLDEYGPAGRWQLDWSKQFSIGCELSPGGYTSAMLALEGEAQADFTGGGVPDLVVECNGMRINNTVEAANLDHGVQHFYIDLGHSLQTGENQLSIRMNAPSGGILQLGSVELWVR